MAMVATAAQFFLIILVLINHHGGADAATHWQDIRVLQQLKAAISPSSVPPGSCVASWDFSLDPCDSLFSTKFTCGFRCDVVSSRSSRLTELTLDSAGYSGNLSAVTWTLPFLRNLDFSNNFFYGSVPDSFSALSSLQRLALSHNSLSGSIPDSLASLSNVQEMYLDSNYLSGLLPSSFNGLSNLERLELQGNNLSGAFPDLGHLIALDFLDASDNSFSGEIPANLPPSLVEIAMRNNQLQGNIPAVVATLSSLQVLDLSHNALAGAVPAALFAHPSLQQLTLSYNQFASVQEPGSIPALTSQLISVDLSNNQIRGFLPGFLGQLPRLSALTLEKNTFSGPIPTQYVLKVTVPGSGVYPFERLLLGGNYLYGPIPGAFLKMKADSVTVRLGDNCLYRCPVRWFFCEGGVQKPLKVCRALGRTTP